MTTNGLEPTTFNHLLSLALSSIESAQSTEIPIPGKLALLQATQLILSQKKYQCICQSLAANLMENRHN